jgi:hypothetical protein
MEAETKREIEIIKKLAHLIAKTKKPKICSEMLWF